MIDIKDKIEKAFDNVSPKHLLEDWNKRKEKLTLGLWASVPAILVPCAAIFDMKLWSIVVPICFLWIAIGAPLIYCYFNANLKKSLVKIGITPTPGIFTFWANTEYRELQLREFQSQLRNENLLTDSEYDIELTEQFLKFCEEESKDSLRNKKFIYGGILLAVSIPIWNQYLTWLFRVTPNTEIGRTVLLCVMFVMLLLCILVPASLLHEAYADHSNKAHKNSKKFLVSLKN